MSRQVKNNQETVTVSFPCVHGTVRGDLVRITCFCSNELKGAIKVVSAIDEEIAKRIIGATRHGESSPAAAHGVIALFSNPMFGGESYGLALAICDKIARLETAEQLTQIIATGRIPHDGCGKIKHIGGFIEKLNAVAASAANGAIFIFPRDNLDDAEEEIGPALENLEKRGIQWRAIKHIDELDGVLWSSSQSFDDGFFTNVIQKLKSGFVEFKQGFSTHKTVAVSILLGVTVATLFFIDAMLRGSVQQQAMNASVKDSPLQDERIESPELNEISAKKSESHQFIRLISADVSSGKHQSILEENRSPADDGDPESDSVRSQIRKKAIESIGINGKYY